jgi:hypothetical protein
MSRITKWDKQSIVKAIMADVPKIDKRKRKEDLQAAVVKLMSPEVRKVYKTNPKALAKYHVGYLISDTSYSDRDVVVGDVTDKQIEDLCKKYKQEEEAFFQTERNLKNAIESCTTMKQLNDRLPEFKKYFPTVEKPVANLPALSNVVADLSKLGWPKGATK